MAHAQLDPVLRHLRTFRDAHAVADASDAALVERFTARHEEAAFTALLRRHGPMVLGVARRILHSVQDAEDVFQATFLLLARKVGAIRKPDAVASWLHGVAHRLALRAKQQRTCRQDHERRMADMRNTKPKTETAWPDVQAALDAALDELPEKYRAALVLCYLEGHSHAEAAAQLGCPLTTLRTHVARGRKLLRERLTKHGLTLSTAGIAALLLTTAAPAASPAMAKATVTAALAFAAGHKAVALCSTQAASLVEGGLRVMFLTKTKAATAVFLAACVVAAACGLAQSFAPNQESTPTALAAKPPAEPVAAKSQAAKKVDDKESIAHSGRVLDPDGKAVAGAKIYMTKPWTNVQRPKASPLYATSAEDGSFRFTVPNAPFATDFMELVATAKGFGPAWIQVGPHLKSENMSLQLVKDDVPIAGQIVDLQGKPVLGATVRVLHIIAAPKEDLGPWLEAAKSKKGLRGQLELQYLTERLTGSEIPALAAKATTDAEGRFHMTGIGRERLVAVRIEGATIATHDLHILTRAGKAFAVTEIDAGPTSGQQGSEITYYPAAFKHVAGPTKPIVGIVRDKDTKRPLAGVKIKSYKLANHPFYGLDLIEAKTDAQGRYRLVGMPKGAGHKILMAPRDDQPYLKLHAVVPDTAGLEPVTVDFEVKRGIWIEGKITDKATGKPLPAGVSYFALADNPHLPDYPGFQGVYNNMDWNRQENGVFRVLGLPGPGLLAVHYSDSYLLATERDDADGAADESLNTAPSALVTCGYNALARVEPAKGSDSLQRDVALDMGETITGTLVGPDDKPLSGARSYGLSGWTNSDRESHPTASFTVCAFNPRRPRAVLFQHAEKKLVGLLEPPKDKSKAVIVKLQPGATVTGRLVDADGQPRANVELDLLVSPSRHFLIAYSPGKITTDKTGRFRIEALLPGFKYRLNDRRGNRHFFDGLRFGETKDLGDVRLNPWP